MRALAANLLRHALFLVVVVFNQSTADELGFSRIVPGWTNYSTAFVSTHDSGANAEFGTVATFYTPPYTVRALEFASIVIWSELPPDTVQFPDFLFSVEVWSGLGAFIAQPNHGDHSSLSFVQPHSIRLDGLSRGGRPVYELRFALTNANVVLSNCQSYLIAMIARTDTRRNGELYVPTAPTTGDSDVQAGNIVPFGWQYLVDAGGFTIYSGQLATELVVEPMGGPPRLSISRSNSIARLSWRSWARCYAVETTDGTEPWIAITNEPTLTTEWNHVSLPVMDPVRFFRLAH
jgi:hypothetical protein